MSVELISEPSAAWEACEAQLDAAGTPLPLYHRALWARAIASSGTRAFLVAIRGSNGNCRGAFAVESSFSRALPGHRLLHIVRLGVGGGGLNESSLDEGLAFLASHARRDRFVLRVTVDSFGIDADARQRTADSLRNHGFARVPATRSYPLTLLLDLAPTEEGLFAGLHKNARQGVRNIARFPVRLSTVESVDIATRLQQLSDRARQRTGGEQRPLDWRSFIEMTQRAPHLSRISILERTDRSDSDSLLAFAWACNHGEIVEYAESGSIRTDDMKISSSYALLWDLILWAKRSGARWFDLGGVTTGNTASDDPLGGISDFKRRFSQHEVEVGEQWECYPHPRRAALAKAVSATAAFVRSGLKRRRV